ncbi:VOC family protein [Paenibacillus methanolicus]|uniref:Catechol 2,3-dioxygenase-like lactoylglutathione lyase family enzyme n=1 Tax=Paenibacillus methanolicus TaxID=582686 RepID=A0A5S5BZ97_9BACL|nr:VOC family protein [Paenibacillus methanolicus]TYP72501.1 catechol 2,3-dioxygenase-like lactoylglutathione lyase family enzyme [Paenibacillus methanolicus]
MLHHIELYVSNLERSDRFWSWLLAQLGYERYQRWTHGVSYRANDAYIVFVQAELRYMDVPYHRKRVGLNHLAFRAASREQVDALIEALHARGVTLLYAQPHPYAGGERHYAIYFEDPDRIKVEIVAPS